MSRSGSGVAATPGSGGLAVTEQPQHGERAPTKQTKVDVTQVPPQKATDFVVPFEQQQLPLLQLPQTHTECLLQPQG